MTWELVVMLAFQVIVSYGFYRMGYNDGQHKGLGRAIRTMHRWEVSPCKDPDCGEPADVGHDYCYLCQAEGKVYDGKVEREHDDAR